MRKIYGLLTMLLMLCWSASQAQVKDVTGTVTDSKDGSPLAKVTVKVKGSPVTTQTGPDGTFTIKAPANATALVFSYVGYNDVEAPISAQMNITLAAGDKSLSEVVVVGYGTKIKRDVTGSIAKVGAKELANTPVTSFEAAMQGRAAGVFIESGSGKLGQAIKVRVRGSSSVTGGNEPLYVVDGIPVITTDLSTNGAATNPLADININDIESVEILKDASAAAIYGARASNGVVLITTKRGKSGKSKIEAGFFVGNQKPSRKMKFMDAEQYVKFYRDAAIGAGKYEFRRGDWATEQEGIDANMEILDETLDYYAAGTDWKNYKVNTNWQNEAFQNAPIGQYDVNLSGGNEKTTFYMGLQFLDQKGILKRNSLRRHSGRLNLDHKVNDWMSVGMNLSFARTLNGRVTNDNGFSNPLQIVALQPITPIIDPRTGKLSGELDPETGLPNEGYPLYYNPLLSVKGASYNTTSYRALGNLYAQAQLTKELSFRTEFGMDGLIQHEEGYYSPITVADFEFARGGGFTTDDQIVNVNTNNFLRYAKVFKEEHNLDVVAGMSWQQFRRTKADAAAESFPSENYKKLTSAAVKSKVNSEGTEFAFLSYFARANYKFKDRYLLSLSGRWDGSSRFGKNNRWGFFPAASAGWIISEEEFLKKSEIISFLKLKGSIGLTGNAEIGNFTSLGLFSGDAGYGGTPGQHPTQMPNPDLKWESTLSTDVGFEVGFLNNRISLEVDLYVRNTKDLLLRRNVPLTTGFRTQMVNLGKLSNKGFEFSINSDNIVTKNFRWTTNVNFGMNRNKITNLDGQEIGADENRAMEGYALGVFVGKEFAGANPDNGDAMYVKNTLKADGTRDRTLTNKYNEAERVVIGNPNPDFIYGMRNTFSYKGFDLEVLLQGVQGNDIYAGAGPYMSHNGYGYDNQTVDQLNSWKQKGQETMVPEARLGYNNGSSQSSRYISSGSYLRLKSVTFGYNIPKIMLNRWKLDRIRVYVRGQNLATITNYKGWDPEVNADFNATNINQGVDFYSAPQARAIIFGFNIGL
ncbi:TonB-dependent receptor [Pseudoflavitalea sp. G-6-1-2]|uniref:SusC/RagA family TonB-linked outer membrane protein n=1 Tax=Pseudoflavitalea sp. G-6-1-2 TaxID=2728841 RepID=UPI00146C15C8|nr:TonB-dependent receptor [Pseudoflavitalea sp. G-6-1-2]NML20335.1 TonB-dependent receptor [Pseudoflavitalea sp. G-6-1-2]